MIGPFVTMQLHGNVDGEPLQCRRMVTGTGPGNMPRQVDHQQRREHIGDAVLHLIASRGLEAASLRSVAAQAQVSMGAVQYYFTTKQDMIAFALKHNYERSTRRIPKLIADAPGPLTTRDALRILLIDLLCLDGESREGARLAAAILAGAMVDELIAETARIAYRGLLGFLSQQLSAADQRGELKPGTEPERAALYLHAVVEGLRWPTLLGVTTADEAITVLDEHLSRLLA
jgi:TetR/AcrR family transcriptional regulator, transcriptional repressor of bet genes